MVLQIHFWFLLKKFISSWLRDSEDKILLFQTWLFILVFIAFLYDPTFVGNFFIFSNIFINIKNALNKQGCGIALSPP